MNYKIYVSGYLEESQQLLVSFSSDDTAREAKDYQSLAFDIVPYGDISIPEILKQIAKQAPSLCGDIIVHETITNNDEKSEELRALIGQEFTYKHDDLFPTVLSDYDQSLEARRAAEEAPGFGPKQAEEI